MPKLEIIIQKCVHINFNYRQFLLSGLKNYAWGSSHNCYNKYSHYHFFGTQKVISYIYIYISVPHFHLDTAVSISEIERVLSSLFRMSPFCVIRAKGRKCLVSWSLTIKRLTCSVQHMYMSLIRGLTK